jgi:hypothetical protein
MPSQPLKPSQPPSFEQIVGTAQPQIASDLTDEEKEALEEPVTLDSSMLYGCYYEPDQETLVAIFDNSSEQTYPCSLQQYRELITTASPGKFMWENFL